MMIAIVTFAAFVIFYSIVNGIRWLLDKPTVERFGYVEGEPKRVRCTCGAQCNRLKRYLHEKKHWTEWICPRCKPDWEVYR